MLLSELGWDLFIEKNFEPFKNKGFSAMRIVRENRKKYIAVNELGEFVCEVSGKFRFETDSKSQFPAVGDWITVLIQPNEKKATIQSVLPRKSAFSRKVAGEITDEQVVAANIDTVFIVMGLDSNYSLRSLERYLSMAYESKVTPVVLLNKTDVCKEIKLKKKEVESIAVGIDVYMVSALKNKGMEKLNQYLTPGKTVAFLGSSGVGKSSLINALLGTERQEVNEIIEIGSRGRHTTTFRELISLPGGAMVIDTPGMRELQVWGEETGVKQVFDDIEALALTCRFRDCKHGNEPNCGIKEAIKNGTLSSSRLESYLKLKNEFAHLSNRLITKAVVENARIKKKQSIKKQIEDEPLI